MADGETFSEDISGLWGGPEETALEPPRPNGAGTNGNGPKPAPTTNGHAAVAGDPYDDVARLANALAGHQVDVVRHADLGALRAEMEDAFTQKLAVALYELLSASNDRFSAVEDHMDQRMRAVATEVNQSVLAQADRLVAAHNADAAQRAEGFKRSEVRDAAAAESLEKITERVSTVQSDLTEMQEALSALREEVSTLRQRPGTWRRWGRSG